MTSAQPVPDTRAGDIVYSMSGRRLGIVDCSDSRHFRVDGPDGRVWLRKDAIFTSDHGRVVLVCEAPGLAAYRD